MITYTVHPATDDWPMLDEEQLRLLAESMKLNGFHPFHPIITDVNNRILDGRNRLAAAKIAGVKPVFQVYEPTIDEEELFKYTAGNDKEQRTRDYIEHKLIDYITLTNVRRDLTPPRKAAATALNLNRLGARTFNSVTGKGHWRRGSVPTLDNTDISIIGGQTWRNLMADAGTILDMAPDLLPQVVKGTITLEESLREASDRWIAIVEEKEAAKKRQEERDSLPVDLGVLVDNGELTLDIALRRAKLPQSYADRVSAGTLSLKEAEQLVSLDAKKSEAEIKEREEAVQRMVEWATAFMHGFPCALLLMSSNAKNRQDTLDAMEEYDRKRFEKIERLLLGLLTVQQLTELEQQIRGK